MPHGLLTADYDFDLPAELIAQTPLARRDASRLMVLDRATGTIARVLSWLPFSSPIIMPMRMGLSPVPWTSVAGSLAVCALGCVFAIWLAARSYRVGMLMYGKKPSLVEVARWVRYA